MTNDNYTGDDPAFPTMDHKYYGLTKRELIAGMALNGFLSNANTTHLSSDGYARQAVALADDLLAELDKQS